MNGGTFTNSYAKPVYNAAEGGTGTINVGGDGVVTFYQLNCSGHDNTASTSYLNISGNGILTTESWVTLYGKGGGYAEANQSGGTFNCGQDFTVGETGGTGVYNLSDGALNIAGALYVGRNNGAVGTHTQSGGTLNVKSYMQIGVYGTGTLTQSGGDIQCDSYLSVGRRSGGVGTYKMTGGTYLSSKYKGIIGEVGTGTMEVGGTAEANFPNGLEIAKNATATGTLSVASRGVLNTSYITKVSGLANVTFDGGRVVVTNVTDGAIFMTGIDNLSIKSGGTTIDTAGHSVFITNCVYVESSGSSLTKAGLGTLTFDELPPVSALTVSNGTLKVSDTLKINVGNCITVADGATLDLSGATVELLDPENLEEDFVFANGGTIIGGATAKGLPDGWRLSFVGNQARVMRNVFVILVR